MPGGDGAEEATRKTLSEGHARAGQRAPRASRLGRAPAAALLSRGAAVAASLASAFSSLPPSWSPPAPSTAARGVSAKLKMPCGSRSPCSPEELRVPDTLWGLAGPGPSLPAPPGPAADATPGSVPQPGPRCLLAASILAVRPGPGPLLCVTGSPPSALPPGPGLSNAPLIRQAPDIPSEAAVLPAASDKPPSCAQTLKTDRVGLALGSAVLCAATSPGTRYLTSHAFLSSPLVWGHHETCLAAFL